MDSRQVRTGAADCGQVAVLVIGGLLAIVVGALVLGAVAHGLGTRDAAQRAADLAALSGARALQGAYGRLFEPALIAGRPNPRHLEKAAYLELGRSAAAATAAANGAPGGRVSFPDASTLASGRVRRRGDAALGITGEGLKVSASAEAERARSERRRIG